MNRPRRRTLGFFRVHGTQGIRSVGHVRHDGRDERTVSQRDPCLKGVDHTLTEVVLDEFHITVNRKQCTALAQRVIVVAVVYDTDAVWDVYPVCNLAGLFIVLNLLMLKLMGVQTRL